MALFTLHPLSVTLATSFSVILVTVLTGVEWLESLRDRGSAPREPAAPRA